MTLWRFSVLLFNLKGNRNQRFTFCSLSRSVNAYSEISFFSLCKIITSSFTKSQNIRDAFTTINCDVHLRLAACVVYITCLYFNFPRSTCVILKIKQYMDPFRSYCITQISNINNNTLEVDRFVLDTILQCNI